MSPYRRHPLFLLKKIGKIILELLTFIISRDIIKTVKEERLTQAEMEIYMRINCYRFPEGSNIEDRINEGCACILKSGYEHWAKDYKDYLDHKDLVDHVDDMLEGLTVSSVKKLMKKYGGYGITYHCERDGSVFETSEITLNGNNSRFRYNHHL